MNNENANTNTPVSYQQGGAKKSKGLLATTIIFAITTLGFGGAFAWAMQGKDNSDNGSSTIRRSCKCNNNRKLSR